jgi:molybdenum cofactor cytidylyltransferase
MAESSRIGALIPAAGRSRRMGRAKPLLPLEGSDFLGCIVETLRCHAPGVEPVVVIRREGDRALAERLDALGEVNRRVCVATVDDGPGDMLRSVRAGAGLLGDAMGSLVWPVDVPVVMGSTVAKVYGAALEQPDRVVMPLTNGRTGHPTYVPRSLLELGAGDGARADAPPGLRGVLVSAEKPAVEVVVEDRFSLLNVNTPEDYDLIQGWLLQDGPTV